MDFSSPFYNKNVNNGIKKVITQNRKTRPGSCDCIPLCD